MVERRPVKAMVPGSSPGRGAKSCAVISHETPMCFERSRRINYKTTYLGGFIILVFRRIKIKILFDHLYFFDILILLIVVMLFSLLSHRIKLYFDH